MAVNFKTFTNFARANVSEGASKRVFLSGEGLSNANSTSKVTNGTSGVKLGAREAKVLGEAEQAFQNRIVRQNLLDVVLKEVGVKSFNELPESVKEAFKVGTFKDDMALDASGKTVGSNRPLTARRIKAVVDAVLSEKSAKKWEKINQANEKNWRNANFNIALAGLKSSFVGENPKELPYVLWLLLRLSHNPFAEPLMNTWGFKFKDVVLAIREFRSLNPKSIDAEKVNAFMSSNSGLNGLAELKRLLRLGGLEEKKETLEGLWKKRNQNNGSPGKPPSRDQVIANGMLRFVIDNWLEPDEANGGK